MRHLLNCRECDWSTIIEGPSMVADTERDYHEESYRNALSDQERCPSGSVAWCVLPSDSKATNE